MASFLRRQDNLETLKTRNLYLQNENGSYPADQSILTISGNLGHVVTSDSITVANLSTCQLVAANGLFKVECATGNTDISGNLQVYDYINQGTDISGTNFISIMDGVPFISTSVKAGGGSFAYHEVLSQPPGVTLYRMRNIVDKTGASFIAHGRGIGGVPADLHRITMDTAGTYFLFNLPQQLPNQLTYIYNNGIQSPSYTTSPQGTTIVAVSSGVTTSIGTLTGSIFTANKPATARFNATFTGGTTVYPTYADVSFFYTGATLYSQLSNSNGPLPGGWAWSLSSAAGPSTDVQITTTSGPYTTYANYTVLGAQ